MARKATFVMGTIDLPRFSDCIGTEIFDIYMTEPLVSFRYPPNFTNIMALNDINDKIEKILSISKQNPNVTFATYSSVDTLDKDDYNIIVNGNIIENGKVSKEDRNNDVTGIMDYLMSKRDVFLVQENMEL
jgi:hypothetical protein